MVEIADQCKIGGLNHLGYFPNKEWGDDIRIQWGGRPKHHINFKTGEITKPYFVEVFPKNPQTFIRVDDVTIEEAEERAWNEFQGYLKCKGHVFEKRAYTNGVGFCKKCNMFKSGVFPEAKPTKACDTLIRFYDSMGGRYSYKRDVDEWEELYGSLNQDIPLDRQLTKEEIALIRQKEEEYSMERMREIRKNADGRRT